MTALRDILLARICRDGPLPLSLYMTECLLHPDHGYYSTRDPLGQAGDFTTAPEISQMFGELAGLCLAQTWLDQGAPASFVLAEAGPGRGTLMADLLRATRAVPGFHAALSLHLIEASPVLRAVQARTLARDDITWHDSVDTLPDAPLYLVANEFFDALPIRQFQRRGDGWRERCVGVRDGRLVFGLSDPLALPQLAHRISDTAENRIVELCPAGTAIAATLGQRIADHGGAALIVDYGGWRSLGDTFQAVAGHAGADPLDSPGAADLTAHVDFGALARAAAPCAHSGLTPQGVFLERLGITERARALAQSLHGAARTTHVAAHRRLTHPDEMGTLFQVLALYRQGDAPPPGLDP